MAKKFAECQDFEKEIDEVARQILSVKQQNQSDSPEVAERPNQLLEHKFASLKGELEAREKHDHIALMTFPNPGGLSDELDRMISQNEDLITLIAVQIEGCERSIEQVSSSRARQEQVHAALQRHLAEKAGGDPRNSKRNLQEAKRKHLENLEAVKRSTEEFLDQQFPAPSAKDRMLKGGEKMSVVDLMDSRKYASMRQILEELVELMFGGSQDPYLTLGPRHWPQYVEVLLRFGVAVRHPSDDGRIKLADNYV